MIYKVEDTKKAIKILEIFSRGDYHLYLFVWHPDIKIHQNILVNLGFGFHRISDIEAKK